MRGLLIAIAFIGAWAVVENLPAAWAATIGMVTLAGFMAGATALAVKWVRNV